MKRNKATKQRITGIAMALLAVTVLFACTSCAPSEEPAADAVEWVPYDEERLSEYLVFPVYRELTVELPQGASKSETILQAILASAQMLSYPEEQVVYYQAQLRAEYGYLAKREDKELDEFLSLLGKNEDTLKEEAKEKVKADLVYLYIVRDAGVVLTEQEKTDLFDRYVEKYVKDFGYDPAYVRAEMTELIYESMLYDKTMEYLILHNHFTTGG